MAILPHGETALSVSHECLREPRIIVDVVVPRCATLAASGDNDAPSSPHVVVCHTVCGTGDECSLSRLLCHGSQSFQASESETASEEGNEA